MSDDALLPLLMVAIFGVFLRAVRRGGSISARDCAALVALAALSEASIAFGRGSLPAASGEAT